MFRKSTTEKRLRILGVSRQESTGNLVLVAEKFCNTCGGLFSNDGPWCDKCNIKQLMEGWTTGNDEYDTIIRGTQVDASSYAYSCLKWIPSDQLQNVSELAKVKYGTIYTADWLMGEYNGWDFEGEDRNAVVHWKTTRVLLRADTSSFLNQVNLFLFNNNIDLS